MSGKSVKRARVDANKSSLSSSKKTTAAAASLQHLSGKETAPAGGNKRQQLLQQYEEQQRQHDETVAKLRADLDTATKCIEQLRREKECELRLARDDEQNRSALALKELETRLRAEWRRDVDRTRDATKARSDAENSRTIGRYERTVKRLSGDLDRCRNELRDEVEKRGTSSASRAAADGDRARLLAELNELRAAKRRLEESLESAGELDKRNKAELKRAQETAKDELAKVSKEANAEIKKLLDELKAKDHQLALLDRTQYPDRGVGLNSTKQTAGVEPATSKPTASVKPFSETNDKNQSELNGLRKELKKLRDELAVSESDKSAMRTRIDELRRELTQRNETIVYLQNLYRSPSQDAESAKNAPKAVRFLLPGSTLPVLAREEVDTTDDSNNDTLSDISCDTISSSTSSALSPDTTPALYDDTIERNYHLLLTEHLNLQKSIGVLLSSLSGGSSANSQQTTDTESENTSSTQCTRQECIVEKDSLKAALEAMKEKNSGCEEKIDQLQMELHEQQEFNEDLEFRVLELEDIAEQCKLAHTDNSAADALLDKSRHLECQLTDVVDQLSSYRSLESELTGGDATLSLREYIDDLRRRCLDAEHRLNSVDGGGGSTAPQDEVTEAIVGGGLTRFVGEEDLSLCGVPSSTSSAMSNSMSTTTSGFDDGDLDDDGDVSCSSSLVEELPLEGEEVVEIVPAGGDVGSGSLVSELYQNSVVQDLTSCRREVSSVTRETDDCSSTTEGASDAGSEDSYSGCGAGGQEDLARRVHHLETKLARAMQSERQSRDQAVLLAEEKDRRIVALQQQVDQFESNEFRLAETIRSLENLEKSFVAAAAAVSANSKMAVDIQNVDSEDAVASRVLEMSLEKLRSIKSECVEVEQRINDVEKSASTETPEGESSSWNDVPTELINFEAEYRELEFLLRELKRVLIDESSSSSVGVQEMTSSTTSVGGSSYSMPCSPVIDVLEDLGLMTSSSARDDEQRKEMELVEQHWKQQVSVLEDERDILRDAVRETEDEVRELSIRLVEVEASERSLREELTRLHAKEDWLIGRNEDLLELVSRLEESVQNHRTSETDLKSRCDRHEAHSSELSTELEVTRDDLAATERRYRRWVRLLTYRLLS